MKNISILLLIATLSGCAGLPSIPPNKYSTSYKLPPLTTRVAFDQYGEIYPMSPPFNSPGSSWFKPNIRSGFTLQKYCTDKKYDCNQDKINDSIAQKIIANSKAAGENSKIIFLIHGYNNSFRKANNSFKEIQNVIENDSTSNNSYVEVYWDGLYRGLFSFKIPNFYWHNALTNSNYAGQLGLRDLLNKLPNDTDLYFVTHSRGAAVALSAFSNPLYDEKIEKESNTLILSKFNKVRIVSFAPAIGTGHFSDKNMNISTTLQSDFPSDTKVFLGFNSSDITLKKVFPKFGEKFFGSTKLGYDNAYYESVARTLNSKNLWLQRVQYSQISHGVDKYLGLENAANREYANCLLWASKLINTKPEKCSLIQ